MEPGLTLTDGAQRPNLWLEGVDLQPAAGLPGDRDADVAIIGAGFTGLWTALYLKRADPSLRVVVLEREYAGFGASGRNGGWCSDLFPVSDARLTRLHGRPAAVAMRAAVRESIAEVGARCAELAPNSGFHRGGSLYFARSTAQLARARATLGDMRWLQAGAVAEITGATGVLGAAYTPYCASLNPYALLRGLATAVVDAGVLLYEQSAVTGVEAGRVFTERGTVRAEVVVRATEAYSASLAVSRRVLAPVYSLITATEPLSASQLAGVGLAERPTFTDYGNVVTYGQRTADGRIVFGGRGAPYHFRSRTRPEFDLEPTVFATLQRTLVGLFPALRGVRFTHNWGGPLGIARDWHPSVGFDRATGLAWAGGYVGDGVATSNLAGRTLADLILGAESDLVRLPWVGHRSRRWELEPLRWLGINAGIRLAEAADRREELTGQVSRRASVVSWLTGG